MEPPVQTIPRIIEASSPGAPLLTWRGVSKARLTRELDVSGAVLLRGFSAGGPDDLRRYVDATSDAGTLRHVYRSTPRTAVVDGIYTATEHPAARSIPLHNEDAYQDDWPMRLYFLCIAAAREGGETPLADTVRVTQRISSALRRRFADKKVLYVRSYREGLDLPWQTVFQTAERRVVEELCRARAIEFEWLPWGLRTRHLAQAVALHPRTGQEVWMNQAHLFHVSSLDAAAREALLSLHPPEELPRNAFYGDGSPIEESALAEIREAYGAEQVMFPWRPGDVLVLDNMLVSHARRPFEGERRVLVAMSDAFSAAKRAQGGPSRAGRAVAAASAGDVPSANTADGNT